MFSVLTEQWGDTDNYVNDLLNELLDKMQELEQGSENDG